MIQSTTLRDIQTFGGTDADEDSLLIDAFEDHKAFISLKEHKRFCVLGRKGSGKTAIFKKLLSHGDWNKYTFGHTFSDYPWQFHEKQKSVGVPPEQCYVQSWQYLCYLTLAKILLNQDHSQPYCDEAAEHLARLERFILDSYGTRDPDVTQIFTPSKILKLTGEVGLNWGIFKAGAKVDTIPIADLPIFVQELNHNIRGATVGSLNPDIDYFVLFDQLDLGFSLDKLDYTQRLTGLLLAAREINLFARSKGKRLTIAIFLRDDIYDRLQFEDKNKITENFCDFVVWDQHAESNSLKSLMERRIQVASNGERTKWEDVFDEDREMSGRQRKYNYIVDRTFLRPRDMIKYCNECLAQLRADGSRPDKFDNKHITTAQDTFSDYMLRELDDEIHKHVPSYRDYLTVVRDLDSLQFTIQEFESKWEGRRTLFSEKTDPATALAQLFEFSIVGYLAVGGTGGGAQYVWRYKDPRSQFIESAAQYRIHPGFKEVLGLKKFSRGD